MSEPSQKRGRLRDRYVLALIGLIVVWAGVRAYASWLHPAPDLFPDEYIYVAISRALGHGSLHVRGGLIKFPEIGEPLLAAPFWRFFSITTAYHLVQLENVVAGALTAVPIYWIGRWLSLSRKYSLACAAFGLALPEMDLVALTSSDMLGYLAALTCIVVALRTLDAPTWRKQVGFLALVVVATVTRLEYFALAPAYIAASIVLDRRRALRRHWISCLSLVPVAVVAFLALVGYYEISPHTFVSSPYFGWVARQLFLLAVECGVVVVPGAIVGLLTASNRRERAFAAFGTASSVLLVLEAAKVATDTARYTERYLFPILVFVPLAFGLYLRKRRPHRLVVLFVACLVAVAAARMPVSELVSAVNSESVEALNSLGGRMSPSSVALLVAILATVGAALSVLVARTGGAAVPVGVAIAVAALVSAVATVHDVRGSQRVRAGYPRNLDWIDRAANGPVTAIQTPHGDLTALLLQMYWNPSITREVLLDSSVATDSAFATPKLAVGPTGELENVRGELLFYSYATAGQLGGVDRVAHFGPFTLFRPHGQPRIRSAIEGRYIDGQLGPFGEVHAWPVRRGDGVQVSFRLSLPSSRPHPVVMQFAKTSFTLRPGGNARISCSSSRGPMQVGFLALGGIAPPGQSRIVTAHITRVVTTDRAPRAPGPPSCTVAS